MNGGVRLVSLPVLISFCLEQLIGFFTEDFLPNREAKRLEKLVHPLLRFVELFSFSGNRSPPSGGVKISENVLFARGSKTPAKNLAEN